MKSILVALLVATATWAGESRWGWDGGCPNCPEHVSKHKATEASWIRLSFNGDWIYPSKTAVANWAMADEVLNGWAAMDPPVKIIIRSAFHPPDLTDAEIAPWIIEFNRQLLERYGSKIYGIQPVNEPWLGDEWSGDPWGWAYQYKRLGASTDCNACFWKSGWGGSYTTNEITPSAFAWLTKLNEVLMGVRHLAVMKGVKVYGPHWQSANYVDITAVAKQVGVLNNIDVFCFGQMAAGEPDGHPSATNNWVDGWANYIDDIIPLLDGKPWACVEFHLNHDPSTNIVDHPDYVRAGQIKRGMEHWRDMGVQCVLPHIGLQNWHPALNDLTARLCGYVNNRPEETLRVIQVALSSQQSLPSPILIRQLAVIEGAVTNSVSLPTVTAAQIDNCYGVSLRSAQDIVTKYHGSVIVP